MRDLILHHYPASPFSEKIRLVLGFKGLSWRSVTIPAILPKPDVIALTGGHRQTPLLQIGADVYCDTMLICRVIEEIAPEPTLYPYGDTLAVEALSHFADQTLVSIRPPISSMRAEDLACFFSGREPRLAGKVSRRSRSDAQRSDEREVQDRVFRHVCILGASF